MARLIPALLLVLLLVPSSNLQRFDGLPLSAPLEFAALVLLVVYRSAGDDWLTYESFARTILETWSLQGGEDVFYYQSLFRYVRFGQRLLLGDGDLLVLAASLSALFFSVLWATGRLAGHEPRAPVRTAAIMGIGLLLLTLLSSATVVGAVLAPLSEQVTWIALPLLFVALVAGRSRQAWAFGAALAGLSVATRSNQAPGLFLIVLTGLLAAWRRRPSAVVVAALLFGACALIPLVHNLYYGGQYPVHERQVRQGSRLPSRRCGSSPPRTTPAGWSWRGRTSGTCCCWNPLATLPCTWRGMGSNWPGRSRRCGRCARGRASPGRPSRSWRFLSPT
jgi:hypothetical protein